MAIQVTLSANEFNHAGTYNDHQYTSIRVNYTSNGRIYFHTIRNGMRLSTMAKQMKLEDGNVIISFGKNDKLIIGTYTDDSIQEEVEEATEQTEEEEVVTLTCSKSLHGHGHSVWINDNRNTNQSMTYYNPKGNESVTIHMHSNNYDKYWEVENYIYSLMKEYAHSSDLWPILIDKLNSKYNPINQHASTHSPIQESKQPVKHDKPNKIEEVFPKLDMVAEYAQINYKDNIAEITFTNATESHTIKLNKHKRWSHKKYVNKAIEHTGIKPSWEFRYGWEYIS